MLLVTSAFNMSRSKRLLERQGMQVLALPVDLPACSRWAGTLWRAHAVGDPVRALDESSRALWELLGRLVYGAW